MLSGCGICEPVWLWFSSCELHIWSRQQKKKKKKSSFHWKAFLKKWNSITLTGELISRWLIRFFESSNAQFKCDIYIRTFTVRNWNILDSRRTKLCEYLIRFNGLVPKFGSQIFIFSTDCGFFSLPFNVFYFVFLLLLLSQMVQI